MQPITTAEPITAKIGFIFILNYSIILSVIPYPLLRNHLKSKEA